MSFWEIWENWKSDLLLILLTSIIVFSSILIPKYLREKDYISQKHARRCIHSFSGLGILITPYLDHPIIAGILALGLSIITKTSGKKSKIKIQRNFYNAIKEKEEIKIGYLQGPFSYTLAITILVLVFIPMRDKYYFPIAAVLVMMYADVFASIMGKKYGKHHINVKWIGNKRTLEGSIAFFIVALICSGFTFLFFGKLLPGNSMVLTTEQALLFTIVISLVSTLLELTSPSKYDDLIVPLGSTLIISLIAFIFNIW